MCNIAGYIGVQRAAPILIDMMLHEEGFWGGYYSGITTIHEGEIFHTKLTGGMDRLLSMTQAASLPGNIGIVHSRSKSGGDDEWAHPFIGMGNITAYVANGSPGVFRELEGSVKRQEIISQLIEDGYIFTSRTEKKIGRYPELPDGSCAHSSDIMCQLITRHIKNGLSSAQSMAKAFNDLPAEIVGVLLSIAEPEQITVARINQPMMVGFSDDGAYISTTALAFPNEVHHIAPLPTNTTSVVKQKHLISIPFDDIPACVNDITPFIWKEAYSLIEEQLADGKSLTISEMCGICQPLFSPKNLSQKAMLVYEILRCINSQNRLNIVSTPVPGVLNNITAVRFYASIK